MDHKREDRIHPLARVKGVDRQQQDNFLMEILSKINTKKYQIELGSQLLAYSMNLKGICAPEAMAQHSNPFSISTILISQSNCCGSHPSSKKVCLEMENFLLNIGNIVKIGDCGTTGHPTYKMM